jgi:hypothetical protein
MYTIRVAVATLGAIQVRLKFLSTLDSQGKLDWSRAFLDGSFVPGKKQLS